MSVCVFVCVCVCVRVCECLCTCICVRVVLDRKSVLFDVYNVETHICADLV